MGSTILSVVPFSNFLAIGINAQALPSHPRFKSFGFCFQSSSPPSCLTQAETVIQRARWGFIFTHVALARHFITHQTMSDWSAQHVNMSWTMLKHSSTFRAVLVGFFGGLKKKKELLKISIIFLFFLIGHLSPLLTKCSALTLKHLKHSIYFCG